MAILCIFFGKTPVKKEIDGKKQIKHKRLQARQAREKFKTGANKKMSKRSFIQGSILLLIL
jgi:hypothetical protein